MSGTMTHPHHHRHHTAYWYFLIVMLAVIAIVGSSVIIPYITVPRSAVIPVTGSQNAYAEYLLGEKTLYAMPATASEALTIYHLGEKALSPKLIQSSEALTAYHFGERYVMSTLEYALYTYRMGEKDY